LSKESPGKNKPGPLQDKLTNTWSDGDDKEYQIPAKTC
jgi:hypothetical protein